MFSHVDRITNPHCRPYKMGFRRSILMRGGIRWYFRKNQRATMLHRLFQHNLLLLP